VSISKQSCIQPATLHKGDQIGIISTARKIKKKELVFAKKTLENWGLKVVFGNNLFKEHNQFAGTDIQRAADLQYMIDNPNIKAIICARGGYGTVRILDLVDFSGLQANPKWIAGYSDVTALHSTLHNLNITSLHSSMPINFSSNTKNSLESLKQTLFENPVSYNFPAHDLNRIGNTKGKVVGGNISIIYSLLGSNSDINTDGKILFLEDLDEYLYHLDRMMINLKRNGKLSKLAGLFIGGVNDMNDNSIPFGKNAMEIISEAVFEYDYPVAFNFPAGHIKDNNTIVLGQTAKLATTLNNSKLTFY
tara:strand:- start:297 stop:1214 length:918 start_codon:yes stop_codon:yes gene_type:complete